MQSPLISIPRKTTEEVDWTTSIKNLISHSYGESPENYSAECAALQRCRQDAVRGAGSDMTARDLLYKYFGQLELLELRFSEIRVTFPWHDAFTHKLTTQTSIAYEKASILFQIASTHSAIASSQNRSSPEGLKRAFYYFRTCAGMLTYINENFLHAPSKDLSKEVIKFLVNLILAQATEVFWEKCVEEKKGSGLISKIASQAATMYTSLAEEVKEFQGQNILDRNWVTLIQIKSKYLTSQAQYHRSLADTDTGTYGDALSRLTLAESLAKEALRLCASFNPTFTPATASAPSLSTFPADASSSMLALAKSHLALVSDRRATANRENDLIYNAILPSVDALPSIETKTALTLATPIPIQEVYGTPEVQKTIGADIFSRLVPLSVHESASVYSEEKAKLVRGEVERAEIAASESKSFLDGQQIVQGLDRFRQMLRGTQSNIPPEVKRWSSEISSPESRESISDLLSQLIRLKNALQSELDPATGIARELDSESRECEAMRVRYDHRWTQQPSAALNKSLRQDLKAHIIAMEEAARSDAQVQTLWDSVSADIKALATGQLESYFVQISTSEKRMSLLDLGDEAEVAEKEEKNRIAHFVRELEERLAVLQKIEKERNEVLKDLKEKIQTDDVSHLLLLNRRNTGVEQTLFAAELEKFRPYQQRIAATIHHQEVALQEIVACWKDLCEFADSKNSSRQWDDNEKRREVGVRQLKSAWEGYQEVRDGVAKGLQFYSELTDLTVKLRRNVKAFISGRAAEREALASKLRGKRLTQPGPPPLAPKPSSTGLESTFSTMSIAQSTSQWSPPASNFPSPPPPPPPSQFPPPTHSNPHYLQPVPIQSFPPPPPPPPPSHFPFQSHIAPQDPYANLGMFASSSTHASVSSPQSSVKPEIYGGYHPPAIQQSGFPPPSLPVTYQYTPSSPPPPNQSHYTGLYHES
ncbi:BRO1 domain-containing protein [Mycena indigotica]|uniref:BRO domain-containing protein 1 n=1 Tax=Mycena indigotica TaxID=2126181 RepID=A0A8H6W6S3_9AGAR|nr:BRO1 domain-containing protein [Mycena indigotica]KAF7303723.1 BRO1 domain-containing protein [Mycena indigotica]